MNVGRWLVRLPPCRYSSSLSPGLASKYAEKLKARMESEGVNDLKELREKLGPKPVEPVGKPVWKKSDTLTSISSTSQPRTKVPPTLIRKDSPPIKHLSSILNLPKLLQSHHTQEQIASLWNLYHGSRSEGTGRGYLSASVPLDKYETMVARAKKYPVFVLPLLRTVTEEDAAGEKEAGMEFFFMEWGFHSAPPHPSPIDPTNALLNTKIDSPPSPPSKTLPPITTVLFTTLQEYKLHGAFAQPRLVLTHHTDLAHSHGVVLLRGEITNSSSGGYLLSQIDAQLLAMGLQRFYLPAQGVEGERAFGLLKLFHEDPDRFEYEQLMAFRDGLSG